MNSSAAEILGHFANFKLAGDRIIRDAILSLQSQDPTLSTSAAMRTVFSNPPPRRRRRKRRSTTINAMSDADLEAELSARRAARARERERYARAMRSEKLSVLETELARLRSEIARLDTASPLGGGTPPNAKWESLPQMRRLSQNTLSGMGPRSGSLAPRMPPAASASSGLSSANGSPAPPPEPLPPFGRNDEPIDAEKQRKEKEERQRRREVKRKEREAAKRPMTLADIIRSAGPDPIRRLKPSGSTQLQNVNALTNAIVEAESKESFGLLRDSLKKAEQVIKEKNEKSDEDKGVIRRKENILEQSVNENVDTSADKNSDKNTRNDADQNMDIDVNKRLDKGTETGETFMAGEETEEETEVNEVDKRKDVKPENGTVNRSKETQKGENGKDEKVSDGVTIAEDPQIMSDRSTENAKYPPESNGRELEPLAAKVDERVKAKSSSTASDAKKSADVEQGSKEAAQDVGKSEKGGKGTSAADAISAISAFASNLPDNTANPATAKRTAVRKSFEERRRSRRASNSAKSSKSDKTRNEKSTELADTLAAVSALKLD